MSRPSDETSPSDRLMYKTIGLAVATIGHALYLCFRYLQHGGVNSISVGLLVFLAAFTVLLSVGVILMKRSETRSRQDSWFEDRG